MLDDTPYFYLEMQLHVHSALEWVASLRKVTLFARGCIVHGKGVVVGVGEVSAPKAQLHYAKVIVDVGA